METPTLKRVFPNLECSYARGFLFSFFFFLVSLAFALLYINTYIAILRQTGLNDTYNDWQPAYIEKEHRWPKNLNKLTPFLYIPADSRSVMVSGMCCLSSKTVVIRLVIALLFLYQCTCTSCTACLCHCYRFHLSFAFPALVWFR